MTLSLANSVEEVEPGGSGCNTQSDSDSESSNSFRFTDVKDVKLMTGAPATTTSVVFKDSPYATVGDTINIHIVKANINGKEFEKYTNHNIDIPCESNVATITYQPPTAAATGCAKPSIRFEFCQSIRNHYKLSVFLLFTVVFLCLITLAAIVSAKDHSDTSATPSTSTLSPPSAPVQKHHMLKKGLWAARSPSSPLQPLQHPIAVLTVTDTGTAACKDVSTCLSGMQRLQNSHVGEEHLPDIRYNFVVGGDGNVYEGRGWLVQNERKDNSVEVAFMGEFSKQPPGKFMALTGLWLIDQGVKEGYLRDDVTVKCLNRTGRFLCSEVSSWAVKGSGGGVTVSHR